MSNTELTSKIRELRELEALIAEAQSEAIKDTLKAHMGDREELRAGEYKVSWKAVASSRLDSKALRATFPEVAAMFTKQTTTRRFVVA